ncbi:MAG TPA: acyl-CoA dehydrogenase family protein [Burkholderiales bacterium]|nr:acyl-CoA dehydrogenase family protein [Burkholderiales bacterium]
MDFSLNEEQRGWQMEARKFAQDEIRPISLPRDQIEGGFEPWDWDIIEKGSKLGFRTLAVPKEWGGPGADFVSQALVMAELAKGDSAISKAFSQNWKWSHLIASACTQDQKERFLKPFLADHRYVMGRGITEPNAGSDNRMPPEDDPKAGYRVRAVRNGDEWILNGEKCFIANGSVGSLFFVDARTNPDVSIKQGGTLFMVPKGTPGFRIGKIFNKRGWRFYQNAELIFENARVPHANVVGDVGTGSVKSGRGDTTGGDLFGDLELAANALGVCDDAVEMATNFARTHKRAGKYLMEHQLIQLKLNEIHMLTEALRSYVMRVAWLHDRKEHSANAGLVMNYSTDVIQRVTRLNMEIHGAEGCMMNARVDKLVRDAMVWTHLAGDTVQRVKVLKRLGKGGPAAAGVAAGD